MGLQQQRKKVVFQTSLNSYIELLDMGDFDPSDVYYTKEEYEAIKDGCRATIQPVNTARAVTKATTIACEA